MHPLGAPSRARAAREAVAHALAAMPDEACGYMVMPRGLPDAVTIVARCRNAAPAPLHSFALSERAALAMARIERAGHRVAVWHSHPTRRAVPSATDLRIASLDPQRPWVIVDVGRREARAWSIADGRALELGW